MGDSRRADDDRGDFELVNAEEANEQEHVSALSLLAEAAPPTLAQTCVEKTIPAIRLVASALSAAAPFFVAALQKLLEIYEVLPHRVLESLAGLAYCFCGGMFPLLLAAFEAARLTGWEQLCKHATVIYEESLKILEESAKDDLADADEDGMADVEQISSNDLVRRKVKLVLTKMEPQQVNDALGGLYLSWLAVIAALKVEFARSVTLALSIASYLIKPAMYLEAPLKTFVPVEYHKWIPVALGWICKTIGMTIAWYLQRLLSAVASAIKGGLMFSRGLMAYCVEKGHSLGGLVPRKHEDTHIDEIAGWLIAGIGFYVQLAYNFSAPFPLNIVLLPFSIVEWVLAWEITSGS